MTRAAKTGTGSKWIPGVLLVLVGMLGLDLWLAQKFDLLSSAKTQNETKSGDAYWRQTIEKKKLVEGYLQEQVQGSLDRILGKNKSVVRIGVQMRMQEESFETVEYDPRKVTSAQNLKSDKIRDNSSDDQRSKTSSDTQKKYEKQLKEAVRQASQEHSNEGNEQKDGSTTVLGIPGKSSRETGNLPGLLYAPDNSYIDQDLPGFPKVFTYDDQGREIEVSGPGGSSAQSSSQKQGDSSKSSESLETPSSYEHSNEEKDGLKANRQIKESVALAGNQDYYVFNSTTTKRVIPPGEVMHMQVTLAIKDDVLKQMGQTRYDIERMVKNMVGFDPARQDTFVLIPYSQSSFADRFGVFWKSYRIAILVACAVIAFMIIGIFTARWYGRYSERKEKMLAEARAAEKLAQMEASKVEVEQKQAMKVEEAEKLKGKREAILQLAQEDLEAFAKMLDAWVGVEIED